VGLFAFQGFGTPIPEESIVVSTPLKFPYIIPLCDEISRLSSFSLLVRRKTKDPFMVMLSADSGISAFIDGLVVLLVARHRAPVTGGVSADKEAWRLVSAGVQASLRHPVSDRERLELRHVDPHHFTPAVCHRRAAYLLWKLKKQQAEAAASISEERGAHGGFDVTKHSIAEQVDEIFRQARMNLPTILQSSGADSSEDEPTNDALKVHEFNCKSSEDVQRDARIAEAEDELMRKVQELQVEFFDKHRRWVEVPITLSPTKDRVSNEQPERILQMTATDVAEVLRSLGLADHLDKFKRTTGRVLLCLKRSELRDRFEDDVEAADVLWSWIEERRPAKQAAADKMPLAPPNLGKSRAEERDTHERQQVAAMFDMFRHVSAQQGHRLDDTREAQHYLDPLSALKRAMNPHRPPRPSAINYDDDDDLGDDPPRGDEKDSENAIERDYRLMMEMEERAKRQGPTQVSTSAQRTVPHATAIPSRAGRWQVQEYDEDSD
jgi:hypothetical protein